MTLVSKKRTPGLPREEFLKGGPSPSPSPRPGPVKGITMDLVRVPFQGHALRPTDNGLEDRATKTPVGGWPEDMPGGIF